MTKYQTRLTGDVSSLAEMTRAIEEGRCKIITLNPGCIVSLFNAAFHRPGTLTVPVFEELPSGYLVDGIFADWHNNEIAFKVYHPSFPTIGQGDYGLSTFPGRFKSVAILFQDKAVQNCD